MKQISMVVVGVICAGTINAMQQATDAQFLYAHLYDDVIKQTSPQLKPVQKEEGASAAIQKSFEKSEFVPLLEKKPHLKKSKNELELLREQAHAGRQQEQLVAEGEVKLFGSLGCLGLGWAALVAAVLCL